MSNVLDNLIGQQFAWFMGVVEDIADPLQMGRVRVRCFGYHTEDKAQIKTEDLPWSVVMTPIQSASMSGIGQSATGVLQGSWVVGFFRDGRSAQDAIVLGTIPSYSSKTDSSKGFADPAGKYPSKNGIDTPTEATANYQYSDALQAREKLTSDVTENGIKLASLPKMSAGSLDASPDMYWAPKSRYEVVAPEYPKNHVYRSESGHLREIDDTPGKERTLDMHKTGTYVEVDADGDKTTIVKGDNYEVCIKDNNVYVKGEYNLTVDGNLRVYVKGNYMVEVDGDKIEYVKGNRFSSVAKFDQMDSKQSVQLVDSTALISTKADTGTLEGMSGIELRHPGVKVTGNLSVSTGETTSFTTVDKKSISVANGIVVDVMDS